MKIYSVSFAQVRRYTHTVAAPTEYEAMAEAVKAFYREEIEPDHSVLDFFETEARPCPE